MNRDLKFRVYNEFGMFYGISVHNGTDFGMSNDDFMTKAKKPKGQEDEDWDDLKDEYGMLDCGEDWIQGDGAIMQYVGIKDKNGKEVYEGDILKYLHFFYKDRELMIGEVVYDAESTSFVCEHKTDWMELVTSHDIEVIGNIYENPELVKAGGAK